MATAAELIYAEQLGHLREIAIAKGWGLVELEDLRFALGLPARDGYRFWLFTGCDNFPVNPPA